ncbi:MAG TPA: M23 family metallopeptidase [Acidimicrobiales bacterium]|nr:M23 family metallopeptidase [Acidimicrobiales bacterium]
MQLRRFRALAVVLGFALAGQAATSTYKVTRGDTLDRIARKHGTTTSDLASANKLKDPDLIREGQVLSLPAKPQPASSSKPASARGLSTKQVVVGGDGPRQHTVKQGENLARIAAKYGTTAAELAKANNLKNPSLIRIGATLAVPGAAEPWLCPVDGQVWFSDSWGHPRPGGRAHRGTDLFAHRGTPVLAPVGGRITHASGKVAGNAFYLHGDDGHRYYGAHLDKLEAGPGRVERGTRVGTVGSTGNAEGLTPHLHFEIHVGGTEPVNPVHTISKWCR